jgi:cold shock CspA family protein
VQFFPAKKFGFIRPDVGQDVFFHLSAVGACDPALKVEPGQPVRYELIPGTEPKRKRRFEQDDEDEKAPEAKRLRPEAKLVELIDRIPGALIENPTATLQSPHHPRARQRKPTWRR